MRYYKILIKNTDGTAIRTFQSRGPTGVFDPGALNVEMDIPIYNFDTPLGSSYVRVMGISLREIGQSSDYNDKLIEVYGGMDKGLPLANPNQSGLLAKGKIFQAFGNWIGTDQTLEFVFYADTGSASNPCNLTLNWKAGTPLSSAIQNTLKIAFPKYKITVSVDPKLILAHDEVSIHQSLGQFAQYIKSISQSSKNAPGYTGVRMMIKDDSILVYDGTSKAKPKTISFLDFIGRPTWKGPATINFPLVMRADLQVGDYVSLPQSYQATVSGASLSRYRGSLAFQGKFIITTVRHVGSFRQCEATSWMSVYDAVVTS